MNTETLNKQDIDNLSANRGIQNKSSVTQKVCSYYKGNDVTPLGKQLAEDIFRIILKDVEIKVHEVLSESLKNADNLPQDIVDSIINDTDNVAVPFIKYYSHLTNNDLIRILNVSNLNKQCAVAIRSDLPPEISQYIVDKCPEKVVESLVSNETANIRENTYDSIIDKYHNNDIIKNGIIDHSNVPTSVIAKITEFLSTELKHKLIFKHNIPVDIVSNIIDEVQEKTTLKISEEFSTDKQIEELVHQLYSSNRLTANLVVRSICLGDLKFFEYALVYLSGINITDVRHVLYNSSADFMIRNLLRKAFIPKAMFPAVFSALNIIKDIHFDCCQSNRKSFSHKVIERILSYAPYSEELSEEDLHYLVSKIS